MFYTMEDRLLALATLAAALAVLAGALFGTGLDNRDPRTLPECEVADAATGPLPCYWETETEITVHHNRP